MAVVFLRHCDPKDESVSCIVTHNTCIEIELIALNPIHSQLVVLTNELAFYPWNRKDIEGREFALSVM